MYTITGLECVVCRVDAKSMYLCFLIVTVLAALGSLQLFGVNVLVRVARVITMKDFGCDLHLGIILAVARQINECIDCEQISQTTISIGETFKTMNLTWAWTTSHVPESCLVGFPPD
jgi:hypothetical protein